ncbi:hypothetical protein CACET_c29470 [Clostridium aceticum]|uniref:Uncharacterized protein n=1 Tax=Clostridium aceticum TaxID=84022 RepID=A0A0D8IAB8_9CLOT|nr:hypothetical protein [Clostridium aceticum]AKL96391.1 hypothetical protein CACET_c29470 [Clostridium aceticum]KJF26967.1 hypothetical protein TZ02_10605 [Clostridium aceticum]
MENLGVVVLHSIPGRIRVRILPDVNGIQESIEKLTENTDILMTKYTSITRTLLIRYKSYQLKQEQVLIQLGFVLSLQNNLKTIKIIPKCCSLKISPLAVYSGISLLGAFATTALHMPTQVQSSFKGIAALGTAGAVVEHGIMEIKEKGVYDFEVISLVYLINGILQNNYLKVAAITWGLTFGRHFADVPLKNVYIKAYKVIEGSTDAEDYDAIISYDASAFNIISLIKFFKTTINKLNFRENPLNMETANNNYCRGLQKASGFVYKCAYARR